MKRVVHVLLASVLIVGLLLTACAKPAPSPTPTGKPAPAPTTAPPTTPKATPTPKAPSADTPQYGGVFKIAGGAAPRALLPQFEPIKNLFMHPAFETLLRLDEKGDLAPWLATDWKLSPDQKSLTLTLRKGVKFHDGTDFNAAAAKFSIELRKEAGFGDYQTLQSIDVIDDYTLRLNLSQFQNTLLTSLWYLAGMMSSPTNYKKFSKDDAKWQPMGTGPFKFITYEINTIARWERFDGYWQKGKPYLDGFQSFVINDATTRDLALRKGEILANEQVENRLLPELEKLGFAIIVAPVEVYNVLVPDSANPDSPYANKKVREALEYAIDREAIVKALGYGRMEALYQMAPAGNYAYIPDLKGRRYDVAKAKQLLAEAGYPNGFKTTFHTLFSIADSLVAVSNSFKAIGIEATIDVGDPGKFFGLTQQGWKNGLIFRAFRIPPDWLQFTYSYVSPKSIESKSMLRPAGFEDLLQKALTAPDMPSKKAASQEVVQKLYDEATVLPLWGSQSSLVHSKNVHNLGYYLPWGANKLWSPADLWLSK
ncbi:MAG: ABC transporter substrate-binding protein [Chloroflexi bacterium]|nr:ABC transporter substrate-binding protein [Chloroflexota bacterium]